MTPSPTLAPVLAWSGHLRRRLEALPDLAAWLETARQAPVTPARLAEWRDELAGMDDAAPLPVDACRMVLRKLRERVFCTLIARDLGGQAPLEEVVGAMTALADLAVAETYRSVASELAAVHGVPRDPATGLPQEMLIVGMGKLGGCELNVSSDIDLIMLYGEEGETDGPRRISHHEFYGRLTRRMMPVLSEVDANGQVFRTDLRLRPDDAGPLAWSLDALEHYLIGQGREWERYAWLKARLMPAPSRAATAPCRRGSWKACACPSCTASISTSTRWRLRCCASASARTGSAAPARATASTAPTTSSWATAASARSNSWSSWPS